MSNSREMRRLQAKWQQNTGWPKRLGWIEIEGIRGWAGQRVPFNFPIVAVVGENGSGKSTLANLIAGRLQPLSGETLVKGVRVDSASPSKRAKLGMRRTFQAAELVRELTPIENVMVGLFSLKPRIISRAPIWT